MRRTSTKLFLFLLLAACGRSGDISATLSPAAEPIPAISPRCMPPKGSFFVFFGTNVSWPHLFPHTLVHIGKDDLLTFDETGSGQLRLTVLSLYDAQDRLVATIENGAIHTAFGARAEKPDSHTLVVHGSDGGEILRVRFFNPKAVRVEGVFRHPGSAPVIVAPTSAMIANGFVSGECFGDNEIDLFQTAGGP